MPQKRKLVGNHKYVRLIPTVGNLRLLKRTIRTISKEETTDDGTANPGVLAGIFIEDLHSLSYWRGDKHVVVYAALDYMDIDRLIWRLKNKKYAPISGPKAKPASVSMTDNLGWDD